MKATVSKKDFQAWLETKTSSAQVGVSNNAEKCPLAKYFQTINEITHKQVEIGEKVIILDKEGATVKEIESKPWMNKFIAGVDKLGNDAGKELRISAKKALDILATC